MSKLRNKNSKNLINLVLGKNVLVREQGVNTTKGTREINLGGVKRINPGGVKRINPGDVKKS